MELRREWLSQVTKEIKNSPLATNCFFGIVQLIAEGLMGMEFACPCDSRYNKKCTSIVFIVPPIIVFLLALGIKPFCKPCKSMFDCLNITIVPTALWLVILLTDGRYYACLWTSWTGKYEIIENAAPQHWCKPANSSQELLAETQLMYAESQFFGFLTALGVTMFYLLCMCGSRYSSLYCSQNNQNPEAPGNEENERVELNQQL